MNKMLLVHGWFAQQGIKINLNPGNMLPALYLAEGSWMFHGHFAFEREGSFEGITYDRCGIADITNGLIVDDKLSFYKHYVQRNDAIFYEFVFNRSTGLYEGTYSGVLTGEGSARLMLTTPPEKFFVQ